MGLGDPKTCFNQFIFDRYGRNAKEIILYFIMHGLGLWIKLNSFVAHMFYAWSFSHNTVVQIAIKHNRKFLSLNTYTNVFTWGNVNSNKNRT